MDKKKGFNQIVDGIKKVKIQGATDVAKAAIDAFLLSPTKSSAKILLNSRPTEPLMQHAIKFISNSKDKEKAARDFKKYLLVSEEKIADYGSRLVKNNMKIYSHCHSTSVISILKKAKKQGKRFVVYTTEVLPLYQGKKTAKELARSGIKTTVFPDLAAEQALEECDLLLFGSDAYLKNGQVNKIGTSMLCQMAKNKKIPRYSCGISLKYTSKIKFEFRNPDEVWHENIRQVTVKNPAFDFIKKDLISKVISEFGVSSYSQFIRKSIKNLKKF